MSEKEEHFFKNYEIVKLLSKVGSRSVAGKLHLAKNAANELFLIKTVNVTTASDKAISQSANEVQALRKISHPNIVAYVDAFHDGATFAIVTVYYDYQGATLYARIKQHQAANQHFSEHTLTVWLAQIASAIEHLHSKRIMHRNLKTQSIFLTKDGVIKVGNFGLARILEDDEECATSIVGTPYYMAPEFFHQIPYTYKTDIWALGCVVFEIATLKHAFAARDMYSLASCICRGNLPTMPEKFYSRDLADLATMMLSQIPENRPSAGVILKLPFIQQHVRQFISENQQQGKQQILDELSFNLVSANEAARAKRRERIVEHKRANSITGTFDNTTETICRSNSLEKLRKDDSVAASVGNNAKKSADDNEKTIVLANRASSLSSVTPPIIAPPTLLTIPSGINALVDRNRLNKRIDALHQECLKGLGLKRFHEAWQIFTASIAAELERQKCATDDDITSISEDNTLEVNLRSYLGDEDFANYASKIVDLKFCEDLKERRLFSGQKPSPQNNNDDDKNTFNLFHIAYEK